MHEGGSVSPNHMKSSKCECFVVVPVGLLFLMIIMQLMIFCLGMSLYFVVSRNLCILKATDVKVCLILLCTSGLHDVLFLISFFSIKNRSTSVPVLFTSIGILVEQVVLFAMLFKKVVLSSYTKSEECKNSYFYGFTHMCSICMRHRIPDV